MGLERIVIEKVTEKLPNSDPNFVCGCLFASVTEDEIDDVIVAINEVVADHIKVEVNGPIQGEYAFDLI
tara:strand:+ start:721 stop:927 length:207 start_codon:yes stop_codon:yes gene_type:complete